MKVNMYILEYSMKKENRLSYRNLRLRLFDKDPKCYWCKRQTLLTNRRGPEQATIDHLFSRIDKRRETDQSKVLACYNCNHTRALQELEFMKKIYRENY